MHVITDYSSAVHNLLVTDYIFLVVRLYDV